MATDAVFRASTSDHCAWKTSSSKMRRVRCLLYTTKSSRRSMTQTCSLIAMVFPPLDLLVTYTRLIAYTYLMLQTTGFGEGRTLRLFFIAVYPPPRMGMYVPLVAAFTVCPSSLNEIIDVLTPWLHVRCCLEGTRAIAWLFICAPPY